MIDIKILSEPSYKFDDAGPSYHTTPKSSKYGTSIKVDPFPCYTHEYGLVYDCLSDIISRFPLPKKYQPIVYILEHELASRTNAFAYAHGIYNSDTGKYDGIEPEIVLSGKRIPILPEMTKYLIPHEFGHCVQYYLEFLRGNTHRFDDSKFSDFELEYIQLRPKTRDQENIKPTYGAKKWHSNIGEIIANDFRILVGESALDFWPHDVTHPHHCSEVKQFWTEQIKNVKTLQKQSNVSV